MIRLESYLAGRWQSGDGAGATLADPTTGEALAAASSDGLDLAGALDFARAKGAALRAMTFAERGAMIEAIARALKAQRASYVDIAVANSGNTQTDAAIDIDGGIGTLLYFAKLGKTLGDARIMRDGAPQRLARDENFQGLHLLVPRRGVAVHINAFNFPSWGLWEKAGVALLAGMPVLAKPAVSTVWLAQKMVADVVAAGAVPDGALSILCGSPGDLLDHLGWQDVVSFTGSAATALKLRASPKVLAHSVPLNVEADSLNGMVLGPDIAAGSLEFETFVKDVARELTVKAGQRCTAVRRIFVPASVADALSDALAARLAGVTVGNPRSEGVRMGPVVSKAQQAAALAGIAELKRDAKLLCGGTAGTGLVDADAASGAFIAPTLFRAEAAAARVHELEVFAPVATLIPYDTEDALFALAAKGGGSLVLSALSGDIQFLQRLAIELAHAHGRLMAIDPSVAASQTGHGNVLPSCIHGGPGRAGGGEELGALRGLKFYQQRSAIQASAATLSGLCEAAAPLTL